MSPIEIIMEPLALTQREPTWADMLENHLTELTEKVAAMRRDLYSARTQCPHRYQLISPLQVGSIVQTFAIPSGGGNDQVGELRCLDCSDQIAFLLTERCTRCGRAMEKLDPRGYDQSSVAVIIRQSWGEVMITPWQRAGGGWQEYRCWYCKIKVVVFDFVSAPLDKAND